MVYHEEYVDDRKRRDMQVMEEDNRKLFAKWNLPERFSYPDPGPAYRKMLVERLAAMSDDCRTRSEVYAH